MLNCSKCNFLIEESECYSCRKKIVLYICPNCRTKNSNPSYRGPKPFKWFLWFLSVQIVVVMLEKILVLDAEKLFPYYTCSKCKKPFFNPRYRSGLECSNCKTQVVIHPQKSEWHLISHYICQKCKSLVKNDRFTNYHSCHNCVPLCKKCGGYLATNTHVNYLQCVKCNKIYYW